MQNKRNKKHIFRRKYVYLHQYYCLNSCPKDEQSDNSLTS